MAVHDVALHDFQLLVLHGHLRRVADEGSDFVTLLKRLLDELASGGACGSEDEKFHIQYLVLSTQKKTEPGSPRLAPLARGDNSYLSAKTPCRAGRRCP